MKNLIFLMLLIFAACTPKDAGYIALLNTDVVPLAISVDGRTFNVQPSNHITKKIAKGTHSITVGDGPATMVKVLPKKTVVFDSTGLGCFVVADFTDRSLGGEVIIAEKFVHQKTFAPNEEMATLLGTTLPPKPAPGQRILRIHQVDCDIIDNDTTLTTVLKDLP